MTNLAASLARGAASHHPPAGGQDDRPGTDPFELWLRRGLRTSAVKGQNTLLEPLPEAWLRLLERLPGE